MQLRGAFTIHFATINTSPKISLSYVAPVFTIHFATINTYLLYILEMFFKIFTIHFATINTYEKYGKLYDKYFNLQYTLLLLIQIDFENDKYRYDDLQYTLLLLIH